MTITKNTIKIEISKNITKISKEELIKIFCIISAIKKLEWKKGNEYDKAWLKIKYIKNIPTTEYINIFNLIRSPSLYDFIKYFTSFKEKYSNQSTDTKLQINDYFEEIIDVSQEIIISMVFTVETNEIEIEKEEKIFYNLLKINNMDDDIFEIVKRP